MAHFLVYSTHNFNNFVQIIVLKLQIAFGYRDFEFGFSTKKTVDCINYINYVET